MEVLVFETSADASAVEIRPRVKPRLRPHRRHVELGVESFVVGLHVGEQRVAYSTVAKRLGVQLLHHPKPSKLTLGSVEVAVVVPIPARESPLRHRVVHLRLVDDLETAASLASGFPRLCPPKRTS